MMAERRDYFRIEEQFQVTVLPGERDSAAGHDLRERVDRTRRLALVTAQIALRHPELAEAMQLLQAQIDDLRDRLPPDPAGDLPQPVDGLSISASGAAFPQASPLPPDSMLLLDIVFGSGLHIVTRARVVACEPAGPARSPGHVVRVTFIEMHDDDRELLIQQLLRSQGALIRAGRGGEAIGNPTAH